MRDTHSPDAMRVTQLIALALAALLVGSMLGPAAAGSTSDASETVELTIEVNEEWTTVTVERSGSAQANADVSVTAVGTADAEAEGEYESDSEGRVRLPTPDADQTVEFEVESDNVYASGVATLQAHHGLDYSYTVEVDAEAEASAEAEAEAGDDEDGADPGDDATATPETPEFGPLPVLGATALRGDCSGSGAIGTDRNGSPGEPISASLPNYRTWT